MWKDRETRVQMQIHASGSHGGDGERRDEEMRTLNQTEAKRKRYGRFLCLSIGIMIMAFIALSVVTKRVSYEESTIQSVEFRIEDLHQDLVTLLLNDLEQNLHSRKRNNMTKNFYGYDEVLQELDSYSQYWKDAKQRVTILRRTKNKFYRYRTAYLTICSVHNRAVRETMESVYKDYINPYNRALANLNKERRIYVKALKEVQKETKSNLVIVICSTIFLVSLLAISIIFFQRETIKQWKQLDLASHNYQHTLEALNMSSLRIDAITHRIVSANRSALDTFEYEHLSDLMHMHIGTLIDDLDDFIASEKLTPNNDDDDDDEDNDEQQDPNSFYNTQSTTRSWSQIVQHTPSRNDIVPRHTQPPPSKRAPSKLITGTTRSGRKLKLVAYASHTIPADADKNHAKKTIITLVFHDLSDILNTSYKLEIQQNLLAQFAHEIRNKITPAFEVLQSWHDNPHEDSQDFRNRVLASTAELDEADQLIRTRLCIYKVMSGKYIPDWQVLNLNEFMTERVDMAASLSNKTGNKNRSHSITSYTSFFEDQDISDCVIYSSSIELPDILTSSSDTTAVWIRTDLYMLTHIANNLLSNARKATSQGNVEFIFLEERDGLLTFAVRDTGIGMSTKLQQMLFQGDTGTGDDRGVGLGLESCRAFARIIGGDCYLHRSQPDQGSEFRFYLPGSVVSIEKDTTSPRPPVGFTTHFMQTQHPMTPASTSVSSSTINLDYIPKRLLCILVDDSQLLRRSLRVKLNSVAKSVEAQFIFRDFPTVEATLPEINSFLQSSDPVAIFIDQNCESASGILKGTHLVQALVDARFPGLIVSATGDDESGEEHIAAGAAVQFSKPYPTAKQMRYILNDAFFTLTAASAAD